MHRTVYMPGEVICSPEEGYSHCLFWIYAGKAEITVKSEDIFLDREPWRAVVEEGRILGEINLLFYVTPKYTLTALTACTVMKLTRKDFLSIPRMKQQVRGGPNKLRMCNVHYHGQSITNLLENLLPQDVCFNNFRSYCQLHRLSQAKIA